MKLPSSLLPLLLVCMVAFFPPYARGEGEEALATESIPDETCLACHAGTVDAQGWQGSAHKARLGFTCQGACHSTVTRMQHADLKLPALPCETCHPTWAPIKEQLAGSAHKKAGIDGCATCHDPHRAASMAMEPEQVRKNCEQCHEEQELLDDHTFLIHTATHIQKASCTGCHGSAHQVQVGDAALGKCGDCHPDHDALVASYAPKHTWPDNAELHLRILDCTECHRREGPVKACSECHSGASVLSGPHEAPGFFGFNNAAVIDKFGYVIGATKMDFIDLSGLLLILGAAGFWVIHGGLRAFTSTESKKGIYLHPLPERVWHWAHAFCIAMLTITGIHLHWPDRLPLFGTLNGAVKIHNLSGWLAVAVFVLWMVFNLWTRRIKHYVPTASDLSIGAIRQARYYAWGIFKREPHPYPATVQSKFNPLQKLSYVFLMTALLPLLLASGLVFHYPLFFGDFIDGIGGLKMVALVHTVVAYVVVAFTVVHIYLTTTGHTVMSDIRSMCTGWRDMEDHDTGA